MFANIADVSSTKPSVCFFAPAKFFAGVLRNIMKKSQINNLKQYLNSAYKRMLHPPFGDFRYPCLLPVAAYACQLWDWGCWTSDVAIRQIATDVGEQDALMQYEQGCVLNFLDFQSQDGTIPIVISADSAHDINKDYPHRNIHKPVLAQHTAFICQNIGSADWIAPYFDKLEKFVDCYDNAKHSSGLYFFYDDFAIGVDNDPCTFFRPQDSSASIYLNTLMFKELGAMAHVAKLLGKDDVSAKYQNKQQSLKNAINAHCWDERDGMYYSCDINLLPIDFNKVLHSGCPRHYDTLIQRIGCWSSFLPLWAGIPTDSQAKRIVANLTNTKSFWAKYGVCTLSKQEKMYQIVPSSNPSSWHGSIWGISNYLVFRGLVRYGYKRQAKSLARKTVRLFAQDLANNGAFHEYYHPDTGEGVFNKDFLSWNMLVANMLAYLEHRPTVTEF